MFKFDKFKMLNLKQQMRNLKINFSSEIVTFLRKNAFAINLFVKFKRQFSYIDSTL